MSITGRFLTVGTMFAAMFGTGSDSEWTQRSALGQPSAETVQEKPAEGKPSADRPSQVIIEREPLKLIDPRAYQVSLQLEPIRSVDVAAPMDGVIRSVQFKPGQKVELQTEVVRLENTEQQLELERAQAMHRAAQIQARRAATQNDSDLAEIAEAKLEAAKAELDLAAHRAERTGIRSPFPGEVFRIHVVEGQSVRRGEPLLTVGDTSQLKVEIPVDRNEAAPGNTLEIRIEETTTEAQVESILPLHERFEPLRELVNSAASAVVVLDNSGGRFQPGQTVYASLIPRHPITEVATGSVANLSDGNRRVQVVRDGVVRDVGVDLLGQVGAERVYISGPFDERDELIVSLSQELPDGTRIRPSTVAAASGPQAAEEDRPAEETSSQQKPKESPRPASKPTGGRPDF